MDEIESQLELIGVTAIEDKLQDEVPESIAKMISAGVKVWMITGDKQETAINIAVSCRLFNDSDSLLVCNANSKALASEKMENVCPTSPNLCPLGECFQHGFDFQPVDTNRSAFGCSQLFECMNTCKSK
jgi:magnesium-transporting ATPase (P-type)